MSSCAEARRPAQTTFIVFISAFFCIFVLFSKFCERASERLFCLHFFHFAWECKVPPLRPPQEVSP